MKKKIIFTAVLTFGLILASSQLSFASGHKSSCSKCEAKEQACKITKLKKTLKTLWKHEESMGITQEQMEKIKDIKHKAVKEMIQLTADKDIIYVDLKSAMWKEKINVSEINKLIDQKYAVKVKLAKKYVKAIGDVQDVLTEEQRAHWMEIAKAKKKGWSSCSKCEKGSKGGGKYCPITGKKMSHKGSMKGSMK